MPDPAQANTTVPTALPTNTPVAPTDPAVLARIANLEATLSRTLAGLLYLTAHVESHDKSGIEEKVCRATAGAPAAK